MNERVPSAMSTAPCRVADRYAIMAGMGKLGVHALLAAALAVVTPALAVAATPAVGEAAPDFELPSAAGETHSLSAALEEGPLVVVFYRAFW